MVLVEVRAGAPGGRGGAMTLLSEPTFVPGGGLDGGGPPAPAPHARMGEGAPRGLLKIETSFSPGLSDWALRQGVSFVCSAYQTGISSASAWRRTGG